jgi:hypothetical protein
MTDHDNTADHENDEDGSDAITGLVFGTTVYEMLIRELRVCSKLVELVSPTANTQEESSKTQASER